MTFSDSYAIVIRIDRDAKTPGSQQTCGWLRDHNWTTNPPNMDALSRIESDSIPLCLYAFRDDLQVGGLQVGGLIAVTRLRWLKISIMSVHPDFRGAGIGSRLLCDAEATAIWRGCSCSYVDTMSHQSPEFYIHCGYTPWPVFCPTGIPSVTRNTFSISSLSVPPKTTLSHAEPWSIGCWYTIG